MLCVSLVSLPDWPEGTMRDVDPQSERIQGFLRAAYIAPLVRRRVEQQAAPQAASDGEKTAGKKPRREPAA